MTLKPTDEQKKKPEYSRRTKDHNLLLLFKFIAAISPLYLEVYTPEAGKLFHKAIKPYVKEIIRGEKGQNLFLSEYSPGVLT